MNWLVYFVVTVPLSGLTGALGAATFEAWRFSREHTPLLARRKTLLRLMVSCNFNTPLCDTSGEQSFIVAARGVLHKISGDDLRKATAKPDGAPVIRYTYTLSCLTGYVLTCIEPRLARCAQDEHGSMRLTWLACGWPDNKQMFQGLRSLTAQFRRERRSPLIEEAVTANIEELDELIGGLRRALA